MNIRTALFALGGLTVAGLFANPARADGLSFGFSYRSDGYCDAPVYYYRAPSRHYYRDYGHRSYAGPSRHYSYRRYYSGRRYYRRDSYGPHYSYRRSAYRYGGGYGCY